MLASQYPCRYGTRGRGQAFLACRLCELQKAGQCFYLFLRRRPGTGADSQEPLPGVKPVLAAWRSSIGLNGRVQDGQRHPGLSQQHQ
jgi:hypothetical protein